ncbi:putative sister chromatid cohesion protein Ctf8 [Pyronema omphalodes]|nr:putative sister chromatid cohesion protein Ctf8 [Pyronema omphalodes]
MPSIPLYLSPSTPPATVSNPLPQLLQTPSGLAIIELQGTINHPNDGSLIGTFIFPQDDDKEKGKKVWLYIGSHQRMLGEMKKLGTPLGVLRRRERGDVNMDIMETEEEKWSGEELEIVEVVYWKVVFAGRPEPVTKGMVGV